MSSSTLSFIRFFAPAVILVVLVYMVGKILGLTKEEVPVSVNDLGYNLGYLIIAAIYQYLPIRGWAYKPFRENIDERIRLRLIAISGVSDDPEKLSWKRVANVFYGLVDNDKSLEKRAGDVMFNGALMTSFADLTAISLLLLIVILIGMPFGLHGSRVALLLLGLTVVSIIIQELARRRHVKLGEYQLDYIEQIKKTEVTALMTALNA